MRAVTGDRDNTLQMLKSTSDQIAEYLLSERVLYVLVQRIRIIQFWASVPQLSAGLFFLIVDDHGG